MDWLGSLAAYLISASMCYFVFYAMGVEDSGRLSCEENFFIGALRCLRDDFLRIHCPWSKKLSIRYRIEHLWWFFGDGGREHNRIGFLTRADLADASRHQEIAQACFISRARFWFKGLFDFLIAPIRMFLSAVFMLIILVPAAIYCDWRMGRENRRRTKARETKNPVR